ncbi:MAG: bifunctional oligoribonuclease/PAP phosphatase NrnA [Phycisphaerae bacterium]
MTVPVDEFRRISSIVVNWRRPLLVTHVSPDGDALGCLVAMRSILRRFNAQPITVSFDPVPRQYQLLVDREPIAVLNTDISLSDLDRADGVLVLDTCALSQLEPIAEWLREASCPKVAVDHHVSRDPLADEYLIDEQASAACAIIHDWARACDWPIDAETAQALYIGTATDTGWFRFSNCDAHVHHIAADLVGRGVTPELVYRRIYESESAARMRLLGAVLDAMELYEDDRLAVLPLTTALFKRTGTGPQDTENLINHAMRIESVEVAVLLAEAGDDRVKVSFRSKGQVDVAQLAAGFGGGGHVRAAGARIKGTLEHVKEKIRASIKDHLP